MTNDQRLAVLWAALAKIADKESRRELLTAGREHAIDLTIAGDIDGSGVDRLSVEGKLTIGEDQTRAKSVPAPAADILAYMLRQLTASRRDALLRELPELFAANGNQVPDVEPHLREAAEGLLKRLAGRTEQTVRGSVSCRYTVE